MMYAKILIFVHVCQRAALEPWILLDFRGPWHGGRKQNSMIINGLTVVHDLDWSK
jgi:hypothetical protein